MFIGSHFVLRAKGEMVMQRRLRVQMLLVVVAVTSASKSADAQDAALHWKPNTSYLFAGGELIDYDNRADKARSVSPVSDRQLPGVGRYASKITAALNFDNGFAYLFLNDGTYLKYDLNANRLLDGYPRQTTDQLWPGLGAHARKINAALNFGNGFAYFFLNNATYIKYDMKKDQALDGYPRPTSNGNWPGLGNNGGKIAAALNFNNGYGYLFLSDGNYIKYDLKADKSLDGYPLKTAQNWNWGSRTPVPTATSPYAVAVIESIECIKASSPTDDKLISSLSGLSAELLNAAGEVLAQQKSKKAQAIGVAAKASGKIADSIPEITSAISEARDDPDDLYLILGTHHDVDDAFWPGGERDYDIRSDQSTGLLSGKNRIVPYLLGARDPKIDYVDVSFWEYDSGSGDDHLGKLRITLSEQQPDSDTYLAKLVVGDKNGGSAYLVIYRVIPVSIPANVATGWCARLQAMGLNGSEDSEESMARFDFSMNGISGQDQGWYPRVKDQLKRAGVFGL